MNDQPKNPNPPLVVRTEHLDPAAEAWIAERCEFLVASPGDAAFESVAARITGLVVRTYTEVNEALLDRLPSLKVVVRDRAHALRRIISRGWSADPYLKSVLDIQNFKCTN